MHLKFGLTLMAGCFTALLIGAAPGPLVTAEASKVQCQNDLEQFEQQFQTLENISGPKTVNSVLEPLNDLEIKMSSSIRTAGLYAQVHPDAAIRDLAKNHRQAISKLGNEIYMSGPIYAALKQVPEPPNDPDTQRLLHELLRDYRRSGVDLPHAEREKIKTLNDELTMLGQTFIENISTDVRYLALNSTNDLAGLPADYIAAHPAEENGKIRISTNYPDYIPFIRYAQSDEHRRQLYVLYQNRGYPANKAVLESILAKRFELANLLGYPNYAAYVTETRMIETPEKIQTFIDQVAAMARQRAEREYAELLEKLQQIDPDATKVDPWKASFISEALRREKYEVDAKEVRSYFQFGPVRDGIFKLTSELFGVTYRPWDTPVWHEDVEAYEMVENGEVIGRFYFDLHPRDNKFKHAAHFSLKEGITGRQIPVSALVCNLPGKNDEGALMEHSQVETFLHEFGHLLHHLFAGQQRWSYFSGIATQRDFVEAPSQMLEEWIWSKDALDLISVNAAGEPIPNELLKKMTAAREFGEGMRVCGQMGLAALSLNYYDRDPTDIDLDEIMLAMRKKYSLYDHVPGTHFYANFAHLYGYSSGYYTYMWSLVISKDLLSRFETEGMLNKNTALEYRAAVLAPGGSKDAADLIEDFLDRPYSFEPFGKWLNGK